MWPFTFEMVLANAAEALFNHCRQTCGELASVLESVVQESAEPLMVGTAGIWLCVCVVMKRGLSRRRPHDRWTRPTRLP